jgi:hypothetical protein
VNSDMNTEPEQIRAEIAALLAELPDIGADGADLADVDLDTVAARLEEAHEVLVRALEAVETGSGGQERSDAGMGFGGQERSDAGIGPATPGMEG